MNALLHPEQRSALEAALDVSHGRVMRQGIIDAIRACGIDLDPQAYGNLGLRDLFAIARYLLAADDRMREAVEAERARYAPLMETARLLREAIMNKGSNRDVGSLGVEVCAQWELITYGPDETDTIVALRQEGQQS